jgi:8-oxo-dGTP pyrophosphatase MutT (NUDIX family)
MGSQSPPAVRAAATVVVLRPRPSEPEPELFMLRRSSKSAFMPDALVFPGGAVEAEDAGPEGHFDDAAHARAAQRECLEEAKLAVELERLHWFDTWLTPSGESPRRFLARFYMTTIGADQGHDAEADGRETRAGRWASAAEILAAWEREEVDLPPPTLCVLLQLRSGAWRAWSELDGEQVRAPILPKITALGSDIHIVMPHDPGYDALPGDAAPAPSRATSLPQRFARRGKRWLPLE